MASFGQYMNVQESGPSTVSTYSPEPRVQRADSEETDVSDLQSVLPSQIASEIDENYFKKFYTKETFLSAVQRTSVICRAEATRYRHLAESELAVQSPSAISQSGSLGTLTVSRDSLALQSTNLFTAADLRVRAIRRKALFQVAVQGPAVTPPVNKKPFPWNGHLEKIRSYFGRAAASYFGLVRFLLIFNVIVSLIVSVFLVVPFLGASNAPSIEKATVTECKERTNELSWVLCNESSLALYNKCSNNFRSLVHDTINNATWTSAVTNILRGQGQLTFSPIYYTYYHEYLRVEKNRSVFPGGLLYFAVLGLVFLVTFLALLLLSYQSVVENESFKSSDFHYHFSSVVLAGWDHVTGSKFSCNMRQAAVRRFMKIELHRVLRRFAAENLKGFKVIQLWILRLFLMLLSFGIIIASIILILIASSCSHTLVSDADSRIASFGADFLPAVVVVILNTFQPDIFVLIAKFENYSPETDIKLILFRLIFSRFCTLVTYVVPLLGFQLKKICPVKSATSTNDLTNSTDFSCAVIRLEKDMGLKSYCWEANIGEYLYKLVILDLVATLLLTFGYSFLRRLVVEKIAFCHPKLAFLKKLGRREFELPVEIVNLFYIQTVVWMGLYFMPLLPVLASVTRFILFFAKKWDLFANTYLTWRVRAAGFVLSFYLAYLCACFIVALSFIGYAASVILPSPGCGPFGMANGIPALGTVFSELKAMSSVVGEVADTLGHPLVAGSCVTIASFVAICCHLYALSTNRRVEAIRQLIEAEKLTRGYYFSQIASTRLGSDGGHGTNRTVSTMPEGDTSSGRMRSRTSRGRMNVAVPSTYGPDLALGSGIKNLRRNMSGF